MASQVTTFSQGYPCARTGASLWPRAAIFDFDGLLVDTAHCWRQAFAQALRPTGKALTGPMLDRLAGASVSQASEVLRVPASAIHLELDTAFRRARLTALPGAAALVTRLGARMPLAIATNGPEPIVAGALKRLALREAFKAVISAENQAMGKPDPDVYLAACAAVGVDPSDAIAFEDSAVGARAARRAGLVVIVVQSSPRQRVPADLRVSRLDDPDLTSFLRLDDTMLSACSRRTARADRPHPDVV